MKKKAVIFPAAGNGSRLGSDIPKPFIELQGKSILQRSIECFKDLEGGVQIVVSTSKSNFEKCKQIFENIVSPNLSFTLVEGGKERQYSIWNAIQAVENDVELIAVHDAVRPFVALNGVEKCYKLAEEKGAAILAVPAKDTIKKTNAEGVILDTPDRSNLWQAQTPQVFQKQILIEAYKNAIHNKFLGTDDASLVEQINQKVYIVEGNRSNLKITYPIDLQIAELIINQEL